MRELRFRLDGLTEKSLRRVKKPQRPSAFYAKPLVYLAAAVVILSAAESPLWMGTGQEQIRGAFKAAISPPKPQPNQPYYLVVTLVDSQANIEISISIWGTDNYRCCPDEWGNVGTKATDYDGKVLFGPIPGAKVAGIKDTLTVTAPALKQTETFAFVF